MKASIKEPFAEHHICSLFFFYGYEAQKVSPDVGIDLMVTNLALVRFKGEAPLHAEVQVKSVLLDANGAYAIMSAEELNCLCMGEPRYCVFFILHGLHEQSHSPALWDTVLIATG